MSESKAEYIQYDHHSIIKIMLNDHTYQFNVDWIPKNRRGWFSEIIMHTLQEAYQHGQADNLREIQQAAAAMRKLLGTY